MTESSNLFLGSELENQQPETSLFHIIPVPYEKTVSYGGGTANGPKALIEASDQLELFDGISSPGEHGIYTWDAVDCDGEDIVVIKRIEDAVLRTLNYGKIPVIIGGEHTVTNGAIRAFHKGDKKIGIVQFDAHADLREEYEGSIYSHACVMKRAVDAKMPLFQIGVRALSLPEVKTRNENPKQISYLDAYTIGFNGIPENLLPEDFPEEIYISIDVDGLDPSVIPATGTPVPGGLSWYQTIECLQKVVKNRKVIGIDVVELAPIENSPRSDFASAKLLYDLMGIVTRNQ